MSECVLLVTKIFSEMIHWLTVYEFVFLFHSFSFSSSSSSHPIYARFFFSLCRGWTLFFIIMNLGAHSNMMA